MARRSWIILVLFLLFEGVLFWFYCVRPCWSDQIKFGATVIGATTFGWFQFLQKTHHDRLKSATEFLKRWNDPSPNSVRLEIRKVLVNPDLLKPLTKTSNDPGQFTDKQKDTRGQLIGALNFFEELAMIVHKGLADERYLYDFLEVTVGMVWNAFQPWIEADRDFGGSPGYWIEFEMLAKRWAERPPWWV